MPRLAARRRGPRTPGVMAVVAAALLAVAIAPITHAQPAPEISRARDLYKSAEAAMKDGRFDDAARDYGAAYELSKDPALFFKIGRANERAGRCDVALSYYARYLREGNPTEPFTATTRERIAACGGDARGVEGSPPAPTDAGSGVTGDPTPGATRAAGSSAGAAEPTSAPEPAGDAGRAGSATEPAAGPAASTGNGSAAAALIPSDHHKVAWLLTGSAIALASLGGVLAYATNSAENDVRDLYVGFAGQPATFDGQTRKRYDDLVDQGRRYEQLSWGAFGLAGAAAAGAAVLFVLGRRDETAPPAVVPVVTRTGAGVAVRF